jgi:hypothetical protein
MAEIDRVHPSPAPHLLSEPRRVVPERERQPRRHPGDDEERHLHEDSLELHDLAEEEPAEPPAEDPEIPLDEPEQDGEGLDLRV